MKTNSYKSIELAFYFVIIFFLLQEWLIPIMVLTGTGHLELIMVFIVICLALSLFNIHFVVSWILKLGYIWWFIISIYTDIAPFSREGMQFFLNELQFNFITIFSGQWLEITNPFRTLLFFILIWMLIYLIHFWITVRKTIFYFLALTIFFIATLDTFTEYNGSFAIVKVILLGLFMTLFLYVKRLIVESNIKIPWYKYIKIIIPGILLIGLSTIIAILLPKSEPQWPDPVPYIKAATGQGNGLEGEGVSKVGYGTNDSRLGGAFIADDTVVFMALAQTKQYWRIETKDFYTSKGWELSENEPNESSYFNIEDEIEYSIQPGPEEDRRTAYIKQVMPFEFIVQPYGLTKVNVDQSLINMHNDIGIIMNTNTEKMYSYADNQMRVFDDYSVEYSKPTYLYSQLQQMSDETVDTNAFEKYLQLPASLPNRVKELAHEIVADANTPYQKARAIETYFSRNGFRYETQNVAIPAEGQDYVDQFLFETKVGYCDNFSTAMVIMLRSVGIPARWVKGFVGGDVVNRDGDFRTYEITNNNAHSWVEAYIPNVGWVNFEPTIGFTNMRNIEYDVNINNEEQQLEVKEEEETVEEKKEEKEAVAESKSDTNFFVKIIDMINKNHIIFIVINLSILVAGILLLISRRKWLPKVYIQMNRHKPMNESSLETMYSQLLKVLELRGIKRKEDQTLKSFAAVVDETFGTNHMSKITEVYEQYIYGNQRDSIDYGKLKESWEYLINRSSG